MYKRLILFIILFILFLICICFKCKSSKNEKFEPYSDIINNSNKKLGNNKKENYIDNSCNDYCHDKK
jgi:hypothetical protein